LQIILSGEPMHTASKVSLTLVISIIF